MGPSPGNIFSVICTNMQILTYNQHIITKFYIPDVQLQLSKISLAADLWLGGGVPLQMTSDRDVYCLHYVNTDLLYLLVLRQPVPRRPLQAIIDGLDLRTRDKRDAGDIM